MRVDWGGPSDRARGACLPFPESLFRGGLPHHSRGGRPRVQPVFSACARVRRSPWSEAARAVLRLDRRLGRVLVCASRSGLVSLGLARGIGLARVRKLVPRAASGRQRDGDAVLLRARASLPALEVACQALGHGGRGRDSGGRGDRRQAGVGKHRPLLGASERHVGRGQPRSDAALFAGVRAHCGRALYPACLGQTRADGELPARTRQRHSSPRVSSQARVFGRGYRRVLGAGID